MIPAASTSSARQPLALSRREALERVLIAATLAASFDLTSFGADAVPGIGADPNLLKKEIPWPRVLTEAEKAIVTALGDVVIPGDDHGPAASAVGIPDFIDEWVSAPYDQQRTELKIIRDGLAWIDGAARAKFTKSFADLAPEQQTTLVEAIIKPETEERRQGYAFFKLFRDRVAGGYYSTKEGWKAIGYTGNLPLGFFAGPSPAVLKYVGLV